MPSPATSGSTTRNKPKRYICHLCSRAFDNIDIPNSHKKLEHGSTETGESIKPQAPAGVG